MKGTATELRAKELFGEVLDLAAEARRAVLDAACASDAALRARVEALLDAAERDDGFLREPPGLGG